MAEATEIRASIKRWYEERFQALAQEIRDIKLEQLQGNTADTIVSTLIESVKAQLPAEEDRFATADGPSGELRLRYSGTAMGVPLDIIKALSLLPRGAAIGSASDCHLDVIVGASIGHVALSNLHYALDCLFSEANALKELLPERLQPIAEDAMLRAEEMDAGTDGVIGRLSPTSPP